MSEQLDGILPDLRAPFPWFGGKSRVASLVWERFGDVQNYVEPFFGSGAVLLARPHPPKTETVNDLDCMVANFWRSLQNDPDAVVAAADRPVNEADQHAIHLWLVTQEEFREKMKTDIDYYDPLIAGRWVYGQCVWIGSGWCSVQLPHLGDAGRGVNRQLPHLGNAGTGVHRKLPHLGDAGQEEAPLYIYMRDLAERLRKVRVCCGDWSRVTGPSSTRPMRIPQSGRIISTQQTVTTLPMMCESGRLKTEIIPYCGSLFAGTRESILSLILGSA